MKIKILGSVYDNPKGYSKGRGMIYSISGIMATLHGLAGGGNRPFVIIPKEKSNE